jgi:hypothetical protein
VGPVAPREQQIRVTVDDVCFSIRIYRAEGWSVHSVLPSHVQPVGAAPRYDVLLRRTVA